MDNSHTTRQLDDENLRLVHQFLLDHKFEDTAGILIAEAALRGFNNFSTASKTDNEAYARASQKILLSFKAGDWRTFFNLWNSLIPETVKQTKAYKILTLNLHVYFTVLPKRIMLLHLYEQKDNTQTTAVNSIMSINHQSHQENCMTEIEKGMHDSMKLLHTFLNTTGKELEDDGELRPFFALPFIEDPYTEPSLSKIFEKNWIDELTESLLLFLEKCEQQVNKVCDRRSVLEESQKDCVTKKITGNKNVPIIPNERNIPLFIEDDELDKHYTLRSDTKYTKKSKSVQTASIICSTEEDVHSSHMVINNRKLMQCTQELAVTKSYLYTVHSNYENLKIRFHKLHTDYHKLMSIARVLTTALENSVKGQTIDFQAMLETCIQIFPDLFNQNIKDNSYVTLVDKSHSEMKTVIDSIPYTTPVPPKLLNFKKIKLHLINGSMKTKLFLLQALRRKITLAQPGEREEAVHEYISKDLLGLHGQIASYKGTSVLPYLLTPDNIIMPHPLQQSTTRLLNALASFRCGRDYLSFDSAVVDMVFKCLKSTLDNDIDTFTCNMMIAMLQKLSLRKQQRIYMIENGLVEWLISHLHDHCRIMDSYRLEYATALLMNLSLDQIAQRRASALAFLLLSTLINLLVIDHSSTLPYVTGALNNFLRNHAINEEAKKMKFSSTLEQYSKYKDGEAREHLEHILKIHRGEIAITADSEEVTDNDNEEFEVLENELEENDPVKNNYGELCGESLLVACYTTLLKTSENKEMNSEISSYSVVHDTEKQVKSLHYERASLLHGQDLSRRPIAKMYQVKNKNNIMVIQESTKSTHLSSKLRTPKLVSLSKGQQISREKINKSWNSPSNRKSTLRSIEYSIENYNQNDSNTYLNHLKKIEEQVNVNEVGESAEYLYENQSSKKSSKTSLASSTILKVGSAADSTVMQKLSSIASLNTSDCNKAVSDSISWTREIELEREEAFLAKPKLPRTPP
ncbi:PREDICTED: lisH domain-containing protein ARMC9-like [Dufourea novaeangliae]|uniref:lisH domain-containing protein ARMC9-like n=1 Tax=Dufourea novaeangliae TaxID=178035 RepID=UPI00076769E7|nr:PREDICTED: lisH domain-containing protein ARMC9-like [Dufourea novaeangliae]